MTNRDVAVIVVAAGRGERLGQDLPKAFVSLNGQSLLAHALDVITPISTLTQLIVAVPEGYQSQAQQLVATALKNTQAGGQIQVDVVVGGPTRQQSIKNALSALASMAQIVLVHDAARALQPTDVFNRVIDRVRQTGNGVIPVEEVVDTIKRIDGNLVLETIDRNTLRKAQTPQGFVASELVAAYAAANVEHTDDASLWQAGGGTVEYVAGDSAGLKITVATDLTTLSEAANSADGFRTGIGTDTHRFTEDPTKKLYLGTVEWSGERGLDGHSDGDAVSHAIVDALLSAAGLGDIGSQFGVDRPEFAGANGEVFLRGTLSLLQQHGFEIGNVSVQIIGNRPKVAPHRQRVEAALADILGCQVSLTATTTDGLGFLGNSEGVAAVASALVRPAKGRLNA
jgi:2-C-methyl-D-erythritol 4-phosphate cytidylyltransferase/2-C-methyl-D-erythritol 2,4-cyclodiphosphate synthase